MRIFSTRLTIVIGMLLSIISFTSCTLCTGWIDTAYINGTVYLNDGGVLPTGTKINLHGLAQYKDEDKVSGYRQDLGSITVADNGSISGKTRTEAYCKMSIDNVHLYISGSISAIPGAEKATGGLKENCVLDFKTDEWTTITGGSLNADSIEVYEDFTVNISNQDIIDLNFKCDEYLDSLE